MLQELLSAESLGIIGRDLTVYKANRFIYWHLSRSLHTRAKSRDYEIVRAQKKVFKGRPPRHLQNHVVWSRILKCSVKSYVTMPSTSEHEISTLIMNEMYIWVLENYDTNGCGHDLDFCIISH
jgi:hypothetical protein